MKNGWKRYGFMYLLLLVVAVVLFSRLAVTSEPTTEIGVDELIALSQDKQIDKLVVDQDKLMVTTVTGKEMEVFIDSLTLVDLKDLGLQLDGVKYDVKPTGGFDWSTALYSVLPLVIFGGLLFLLFRQARGANNQAMSFGRSRARLMNANTPTVTFEDVAGVEEAKQDLQEVVEFLKSREKFQALGARIPRGVLLVGPPGTGKTLLARAVAGEAGVPFFSISGSEFVEMFVGVGASRVRDLFDQAKRNTPCIIFIDEIDAVGRHRGAGLGGGHDEREQTLNQILVEMDGFDTNTNVIVIAATNRPDILDPALLRPGRFDRRVILDRPDINGRMAILKVHTNGKPLDASVDLQVLAKQTAGFTGADLANLVNEAAILAARRNQTTITLKEMEESIDRVVAGPERKSRLINPKDKEITAYHEAGHALVARSLPQADPVHKVSIVARGMSLGHTSQLPTEDRYMMTRSQFEAMLATFMGGHVAEELIFQETTTGSQNDIERATKLARAMVTEYGMSITPPYKEESFSAILELLFAGSVESIEVYGDDLLCKTKQGQTIRSRKEGDFALIEFLQKQEIKTGSGGVQVYVKSQGGLGGLGPRTFGKKEEMVFLGKEISEQRDYGEDVARQIDDEVHNFIQKAYETAKGILTEKRDRLVHLAKKLVDKETLEGADLDTIFTEPLPAAQPAAA